MSNFEVTEPILNSPFEESCEYWWIVEGETPRRRPGRRFAHYFYRDPRAPLDPARGGVLLRNATETATASHE